MEIRLVFRGGNMKSLDNKRTTAIDLSILAAITMLLSFWGGELYYHPDVLTEWAFTAVTHNGNPQFFIYPAPDTLS